MKIAELEIPAYHNRPSSPTNLTRHQALDLNVPIGCGDVPVFPGDILVGDDESVIVIPAHLADEVAEEAKEMGAHEDFFSEQVTAGGTIRGLSPPTREATPATFGTRRRAQGSTWRERVLRTTLTRS